jgi:NAD(P)-dependent dehydrogenase (short-subunit alcohol dehydrogenase family)
LTTLRATGAAIAAHAPDVGDPAEAAGLIDATIAAYAGIDVLVNNVGGGGGARIADSSDDDSRGALERNLVQTVRMMRLAPPALDENVENNAVLVDGAVRDASASALGHTASSEVGFPVTARKSIQSRGWLLDRGADPASWSCLTNPGGWPWRFKRRRFPRNRDESPGTRASLSARTTVAAKACLVHPL